MKSILSVCVLVLYSSFAHSSPALVLCKDQTVRGLVFVVTEGAPAGLYGVRIDKDECTGKEDNLDKHLPPEDPPEEPSSPKEKSKPDFGAKKYSTRYNEIL